MSCVDFRFYHSLYIRKSFYHKVFRLINQVLWMNQATSQRSTLQSPNDCVFVLVEGLASVVPEWRLLCPLHDRAPESILTARPYSCYPHLIYIWPYLCIMCHSSQLMLFLQFPEGKEYVYIITLRALKKQYSSFFIELNMKFRSTFSGTRNERIVLHNCFMRTHLCFKSSLVFASKQRDLCCVRLRRTFLLLKRLSFIMSISYFMIHIRSLIHPRTRRSFKKLIESTLPPNFPGR